MLLSKLVYTHSDSYQALLSQNMADSWQLIAQSHKVENFSLVPAVHLLSLVKDRNNESSPKANLLNSAPNRIYRLHNHLVSMESLLFCSARRLEADKMDGLYK